MASFNTRERIEEIARKYGELVKEELDVKNIYLYGSYAKGTYTSDSEIVKHIPSLEDHGHLYMYYGIPYSEECYVYGDDEEGNNLIVSYECDDLCRTIADEFQYDYEWLDILHNNQIILEKIFDVDVETQDFAVIVSLLLYLVESVTFEDKFIDALNNGYLIRLVKRLQYLN